MGDETDKRVIELLISNLALRDELDSCRAFLSHYRQEEAIQRAIAGVPKYADVRKERIGYGQRLSALEERLTQIENKLKTQ